MLNAITNIDSIFHGAEDDALAMLITRCDNGHIDSDEQRRIGL